MFFHDVKLRERRKKNDSRAKKSNNRFLIEYVFSVFVAICFPSLFYDRLRHDLFPLLLLSLLFCRVQQFFTFMCLNMFYLSLSCSVPKKKRVLQIVMINDQKIFF